MPGARFHSGGLVTENQIDDIVQVVFTTKFITHINLDLLCFGAVVNETKTHIEWRDECSSAMISKPVRKSSNN